MLATAAAIVAGSLPAGPARIAGARVAGLQPWKTTVKFTGVMGVLLSHFETRVQALPQESAAKFRKKITPESRGKVQRQVWKTTPKFSSIRSQNPPNQPLTIQAKA